MKTSLFYVAPSNLPVHVTVDVQCVSTHHQTGARLRGTSPRHCYLSYSSRVRERRIISTFFEFGVKHFLLNALVTFFGDGQEVTSQSKLAAMKVLLERQQANSGNIDVDFLSAYFIDSGAPSRLTWRTSTDAPSRPTWWTLSLAVHRDQLGGHRLV